MVSKAPTRRSVKGMPAATMCRGTYSSTSEEPSTLYLTVTPIFVTQERSWSQKITVISKPAASPNSRVIRATHELNIYNERYNLNHEMMDICLVHTILSLRWKIIADIRRGVACVASLIFFMIKVFYNRYISCVVWMCNMQFRECVICNMWDLSWFLEYGEIGDGSMYMQGDRAG